MTGTDRVATDRCRPTTAGRSPSRATTAVAAATVADVTAARPAVEVGAAAANGVTRGRTGRNRSRGTRSWSRSCLDPVTGPAASTLIATRISQWRPPAATSQKVSPFYYYFLYLRECYYFMTCSVANPGFYLFFSPRVPDPTA
jgi:hypothetical protein